MLGLMHLCQPPEHGDCHATWTTQKWLSLWGSTSYSAKLKSRGMALGAFKLRPRPGISIYFWTLPWVPNMPAILQISLVLLPAPGTLYMLFLMPGMPFSPFRKVLREPLSPPLLSPQTLTQNKQETTRGTPPTIYYQEKDYSCTCTPIRDR